MSLVSKVREGLGIDTVSTLCDGCRSPVNTEVPGPWLLTAQDAPGRPGGTYHFHRWGCLHRWVGRFDASE